MEEWLLSTFTGIAFGLGIAAILVILGWIVALVTIIWIEEF